ncbi:assimilatory sulfite reductase (NADPH) flavoprotein subunit [Xylella fastidiosa subsp. fastidiosa]|nr:assimilatory sulfite reductase (NADPH) flavoprotein subunit [Xylella fastidiosa]ACB92191.1 sulfite reductase (NADPH) flavoprotein, alpha chain [Xylella fastidiosa M23]EGO82030.1 Sulfite reductase flavoprotein subunit CysJ [Xylella fastidiosa EB92.1]KGM20912.1 NADP oxidoreductase [Xylella fastidiosa]MBE0261711.1 assimilatory sulfite reductase (NADPH) flavoprotein subunit [Xylella fastidiosa subsp. fastidiosa]MBE0263759.1 assimilatory sulfite reductase (NADPH) flavoprotein subunit [Xylella fa
MTAPTYSLTASPLPEDRRSLLMDLVKGLDTPSLWWLSGYVAGLAQSQLTSTLTAVQEEDSGTQAKQRLTVLYGSQTGNAQRIAEQLAAEAEAAGLARRLIRADDYTPRELAAERLLYIVISTQGEGDPPDDSIGFVEFLNERRAPKLPELKYAVLGLGDSSYADFCGIARRLDARLQALGAQRLQPLGEADVDIDTVATPWLKQALHHAREQLKNATAPLTNVTPLRGNSALRGSNQTFQAELFKNQLVSGRDFKGPAFRTHGQASKRVHHLELSLEGSGLHYEPGDALGVHHRNPNTLVDAVLTTLKLSAHTEVTQDKETLPLSEWLATRREVTRLSRPFLAAHAERSGAEELRALLTPTQTAGLATLLNDHQLIDVLRRWPADWDHTALVAALRPLTPRLYSIASSRKRVGEEVHITIDELHYQAHGHEHIGAASSFLAGLTEADTLPVYIQPNERFRLPADATRDIIMIGSGTGVAPFRAFVQERAESGATGRNWLFFGAQHFNCDFLYQTEWQQALQRGELHALDLAFSRDHAEKIYVQHRLLAQGQEVYTWLQNGAYLYVCGAISMSKDVHTTLLQILVTHGNLTKEAAAETLIGMQREGRYARDVY